MNLRLLLLLSFWWLIAAGRQQSVVASLAAPLPDHRLRNRSLARRRPLEGTASGTGRGGRLRVVVTQSEQVRTDVRNAVVNKAMFLLIFFARLLTKAVAQPSLQVCHDSDDRQECVRRMTP
jgi:hypothetical protein